MGYLSARNVNRDRSSKKPKLSKEKSDLLEQTFSIGLETNRRYMVETLQSPEEYYKEFGTSLVKYKNESKRLRLGNWVARQRAAFKEMSHLKSQNYQRKK